MGLSFDVETETVKLSRWLLLPQGKEYRSFNLIRYETGKPETAQHVDVVTRYVAEDFTILAFKLLSLKTDHLVLSINSNGNPHGYGTYT